MRDERKRFDMTDNRTTELLCKLLEERGVSCQTHYLHASWYVGPKLYDAVDNLDGTLTASNLTPEQAIAATLGSVNPDGLPNGLTLSDDGKLLNWRGENYVKQSTLGGGECEFEIKDNMNESEGTGAVWWECSSCHWQIEFFHSRWLVHAKFCPECGARIQKAVKR